MTVPGITIAGGSGLMTLGDSIITLSNSAGNTVWQSATSSTYAVNTATIVCTAASPNLNPSSSNYNGTTFKFTGGGTVSINGGNTSGASFQVDASAPQTTLKFPTAASGTWSIVNLSVAGTAGAHHSIVSGTTNTTSALIVTGAVTVSYCDFIDTIVTGASAPIPVDANSIDNGNTQGVKFTKPYVAQAKKSAGTAVSSLAQLLPINVTAGNTIIVGIQTASRLVNTVTDSLGNVYTPLFQKTAPIGELWYCPNVLGGTNTVTVTVAGGTDAGLAVSIMEIGSVAAAPLDQSVLADGTSTTPSSGASPSTTVADEIVIGWMAANTTSGTPTLGTGYKNLVFNSQATGAQALEQKTVAATGAQTATFGIGASVAWHCAVVTFKVAATAAAAGIARFTGPAQLTGSPVTLYTCPTSRVARTLHIHASNPSSSAVDVTISIGADAADTRVYGGFSVPADSVIRRYDQYDLAAGETIQAWASSAAAIVLTITGYTKVSA